MTSLWLKIYHKGGLSQARGGRRVGPKLRGPRVIKGRRSGRQATDEWAVTEPRPGERGHSGGGRRGVAAALFVVDRPRRRTKYRVNRKTPRRHRLRRISVT